MKYCKNTSKMKKLAFIIVLALSSTLHSQNIDRDSSYKSDTNNLNTEFEDGVMTELSKWNLNLKGGDNDSLTFALLPTLFTNPATKYEFEKIKPRIVTEVFVNIITSNGDLSQITLRDWITKYVSVLDITKWNISYYTIKHAESLTQFIDLDNIVS
jgi:hypothetical protein